MPSSKPGLSPTKLLVGLSLCVASTVSFSTPASAACQAGTPNCVLPVRDGVTPTQPDQPGPPPTEFEEDGGFLGGSGWLLGLLALAALIAAVLAFTGDDEEGPISP